MRARTQPRGRFDERRATADIEERDRLAGTEDGEGAASARRRPPSGARAGVQSDRWLRVPLPRPRIEHQHADTAGRSEDPNRHLWTPMSRDIQRAARGTAERTECQKRRVADAQRIVAGRERRRRRRRRSLPG